jgi:hypothetical protein
MAAQFDVLHFHTDNLHFPVFSGVLAARTVTTLHSRQVGAPLMCSTEHFPQMPLVSISHAQREAVPHALRRNHPARPARHLLPLTAQPSGGISRFLVGSRGKNGLIEPLRLRARLVCRSRWQRKSAAPMTTTSERTSHLCSPSPGWGSSAKSTSGKRRGSWVTPGDSCFPLIGRNHSDWS